MTDSLTNLKQPDSFLANSDIIKTISVHNTPINEVIQDLQDAAKKAEHDGWTDLHVDTGFMKLFLCGSKKRDTVLKPCGR